MHAKRECRAEALGAGHDRRIERDAWTHVSETWVDHLEQGRDALTIAYRAPDPGQRVGKCTR